MSKISTLVARSLINLTEDSMYVYGTSGKLIELKPTTVSKLADGSLPVPEEDCYYVVNADMREILEEDSRHKNSYVMQEYVGSGRNEEKIYKFYNAMGAEVVPTTDFMGKPGETMKEYSVGALYH